MCQIEGPVFIWGGGISTIRFWFIDLLLCLIKTRQTRATSLMMASCFLCLMKTTVRFNA